MNWLRLVAGGVLAVGLLPIAHAQDAQDSPNPEQQQPDRGVARISLINGDVAILRGDAGERIAAAVNAPLVLDDRLGTGPSSSAEIQFDSANMLRLSADSEVRIAELEYGRFQVQVGHGTVTFRVLRESRAQVEVATPSVSVRPSRVGSYRITVHEDGQTEITARYAELEVYTPTGAERVPAGQTMMVRGSPSDPEFQMVRANPEDEWDRWNEHRDQELNRSASRRYVSPDIYGAEDLDGYGRWVNDPAYGTVWSPNVEPGWAPYQVGRWAWVDWYGWTWVSGDPWGWAPYHYGRWYYGSTGWCWFPGSSFGRHYWSPGLVAFFGFGGHGGVGFGFGGLGWVPLAPYERYHPWYGRGIYGGYRNGNVIGNNVNVVNNTNISNVYRNARVGNAVTGVSTQDFAQGHFNNRMILSHSQIQQAGLVQGALPMAPQRESLRVSGAAPSSAVRISSSQGRFFSRSQPAQVNRVPFEQQRQSLEQASRSVGRPAANGAAGWGRFGTTSAGTGAVTPRLEHNSATTATTSNETRGWRRFGEPSREAPNSATNSSTNPANSSVNSYRSDRPSTATGQMPAFRPSTPAAPSYNRYENRPSSSGYRPVTPQSSPASAPPRSTPRSDSSARGGGATRSAPPSGSGGRSAGGGGGHSSGGGGGHSGGGHGR